MIKSFIFDRPPQLSFLPGQYVWVSLPGFNKSPMAIASGNKEKELRLTIRKWGDLTYALFEKKVGDTVEIEGPHGTHFPSNDVKEGDKWFLIAGGTGITPIRSLIHSVNSISSIILYGVKNDTELLFNEQYQEWNTEVKTISEERDISSNTRSGLVTDLISDQRILSSDNFFICGPTPMMKAVVEQLTNLGIPESQIYVSLEKFDVHYNVIGPVLPLDHELVEF